MTCTANQPVTRVAVLWDSPGLTRWENSFLPEDDGQVCGKPWKGGSHEISCVP